MIKPLGSRVLIKKKEGEEYLIVKQDDILAIVE